MDGTTMRQDIAPGKLARFRHRAHANPLADDGIPLPCTTPEEFPFEKYYEGQAFKRFDILDIGCGYGDFVKDVSRRWPRKCVLGLEIRDIPVALGQRQLLKIREDEGVCRNGAIVRCNAMRALPRLIVGGTVEVITIMFPDPQFKRSHAQRRIVSGPLATEYAYYLKEGGYLFICTDVHDLFVYMTEVLNKHPLFEKVEHADLDPLSRDILDLMLKTADADRHQRKNPGATVYRGVYRVTK
ncbi:putative tRNA methyltransferase subunit [Giardia muris]|uniref:tRNA (guanine-N(7)-)-methyltransferase n=1 Tax=Giardia muris TaxID=5742 RepID=A0A4Z1SRB6_GIAMU|nr:putative tRNA methyltransferase subunit [Giardia muris]|eukprot:TNJ28432.1 putative tRNA methyltransferase subunit [Giardia muris]